ncbi:hypothetical protein B6A42_25770 (plasmid) [Vibrio coralliilyticus]|nr:hypothetical protein B6A42_25770 [Vibrio coralliilyticus]
MGGFSKFVPKGLRLTRDMYVRFFLAHIHAKIERLKVVVINAKNVVKKKTWCEQHTQEHHQYKDFHREVLTVKRKMKVGNDGGLLCS